MCVYMDGPRLSGQQVWGEQYIPKLPTDQNGATDILLGTVTTDLVSSYRKAMSLKSEKVQYFEWMNFREGQ